MTKKLLFSIAFVFSIGSASSQLAMVTDIYAGATSSTPDFLFPFAGEILFTAEHDVFGIEVWELKP